MYVANAFTPNGVGINDIFNPIGTGIIEGEYELLIYSRWGELIFESNNIVHGWDGKANNGSEIVQEDVYVWKINVVGLNGYKQKLIGSVSVVR